MKKVLVLGILATVLLSGCIGQFPGYDTISFDRASLVPSTGVLDRYCEYISNNRRCVGTYAGGILYEFDCPEMAELVMTIGSKDIAPLNENHKCNVYVNDELSSEIQFPQLSYEWTNELHVPIDYRINNTIRMCCSFEGDSHCFEHFEESVCTKVKLNLTEIRERDVSTLDEQFKKNRDEKAYWEQQSS